MKRSIVSLLAVLILATAGALASEYSPIEARLVVPDSRLLPGVPFEAWIDVKNVSPATVSVGLKPTLNVTDHLGVSFETEPEWNDVVLYEGGQGSAPVYYLTLGSGESETLTFPIQHILKGAAIFEDSRLSKPGRYSLTIRLDQWGEGLIEKPITFTGAVTTNAVVIERAVRRDIDKKVWERMTELTDGKWLPRTWELHQQMIDEVLSSYSDSEYVPYALLVRAQGGAKNKKEADELVLATRRFANSPVIEMLHHVAAAGQLQTAGGDPAEYAAQWGKIEKSTRPTTRARVFGRQKLDEASRPPVE